MIVNEAGAKFRDGIDTKGTVVKLSVPFVLRNAIDPFSYETPFSFFSTTDDGLNWFVTPGIRRATCLPDSYEHKVIIPRI